MSYLDTARVPWYSLRNAVTADDSAITVFKKSNWPAVGADPEIGQNGALDLTHGALLHANGVMIAAFGAGGDDTVITGYKIYGVTCTNGPIVLLFMGVMTSGSQACAVHPLTGAALTSNFWVDTITVTGGVLSDSSYYKILDSASNRICMLSFDTRIFDQLYLEYDESSTGMTAFNAIITGY